MFKAFLIKYGEIAIKGKNRYLFENALVAQIRHALKAVEGAFQVTKEQGRIYVEALEDFDFDETVEALKRVFGIVGICPVVILEDEGFERLAEEVVSYLHAYYGDCNKTFKVHARRARKTYPLQSMELNAQLGGKILEAFPGMKVDVHKPELMLYVEIRERIYLYSDVIPGPGGMPVGTNGKSMLLLSGGIDSPVAGYMVAKRGVKTTIGRFNLAFNAALFITCGVLFDLSILIYSALNTIFNAMAIDRAHRQSVTVQVLIFTKKEQPELDRFIMDNLHRGVTRWEGKGVYTGEATHILCVCMNKYEIDDLREALRQIDPKAFFIVQEGVHVSSNFERRLS